MDDKSKLELESGRAKNRPTRRDFSRKDILGTPPPRVGFIRRLVNEETGRIEMMLKYGWTFVDKIEKNRDVRLHDNNASIDTVERRHVNSGRDARAHTAVWMEIPEDIYNEAQAQKQEYIDKIQASVDPKHRLQPGTDFGELKIT